MLPQPQQQILNVTWLVSCLPEMMTREILPLPFACLRPLSLIASLAEREREREREGERERERESEK
jgi:hypothetical protein